MKTINNRITIHVCTKDRDMEFALLLQSLRTQIFENWDLVVLDENIKPIAGNHTLVSLLNKIKLEGHGLNIIKNELKLGVCNARNLLIEKDYFDNDFVCRLDDDVIAEPDYLSRLLDVINSGYDIASGITPALGYPVIKREIKHVRPIINKINIDKEGNLIEHKDECGYGYNESDIIKAHDFRSCALMKKEVIKKVKYETNLSPVGFREEAFFSFRAQWEGFTIGIATDAIAYHIMAPTGGVRCDDYAEKVNSDDTYFKKWFKEETKKRGKLPWEK